MKKDEKSEVPMLPQLHLLVNVLGSVSALIFISGIILLLYIFFFAEKSSPEIGILRRIIPGLYLLICGVLPDACIYALSRVAVNPHVYFSNEKQRDNNDTRYDPQYFTRHVMTCGLIAGIMLLYILDESWFYGFAFGLAYTVAAVCFVLIVYYKKLIKI